MEHSTFSTNRDTSVRIVTGGTSVTASAGTWSQQTDKRTYCTVYCEAVTTGTPSTGTWTVLIAIAGSATAGIVTTGGQLKQT